MENETNLGLSKAAIIKLARRAGVKSLSEDCYDTLRNLTAMKLNEIIKTILTVNNNHNIKTVMSSDVYKALDLLGYNVTESSDLDFSKKKI